MKGVYKMIDVKKIDQMYYYEGKDLGAVYSKESTSFRVWAPTAEVVKLCLYEKEIFFLNNHTELFENFIVMKISCTFCKRLLNVYFS